MGDAGVLMGGSGIDGVETAKEGGEVGGGCCSWCNTMGGVVILGGLPMVNPAP